MTTEFKKQLTGIRRQIHRYPELGGQEFKTTALIEQHLKKAGIKTSRITPTGVVGTLKGAGTGEARAVIALRADIDALPITEKTGKPYASSRPGIMHACGHDGNCTMALGAALILARRRSEFAGTVKFIFQPNEENSGGARSLIDAGALKNPVPDAIVGIHVSPWLRPGVLGLKSGEMMAAVDRFTIEIIGEGSHGAYPHQGIDAIVAAAQVVQGLQAVVSREREPVAPAVLSIGTINGGERYNIVCGKVTMVGTVRTLNEALRRDIRKKMERKIRHIAAAYGARCNFVYEKLGPPLVNDGRVLELCRSAGGEVLGSRNIVMLEKPSMGGEDFAEYLRQVPGCFLYLGCGGPDAFPWHHERFDIDESVLPAGAELLAGIAVKYFNR